MGKRNGPKCAVRGCASTIVDKGRCATHQGDTKGGSAKHGGTTPPGLAALYDQRWAQVRAREEA